MRLDTTPEGDFSQTLVEPEPAAQGQGLVSIEATVPTVESLIAKAVEHGISVEGLEKLRGMHERMKAAAAREAFFEALSAFQADCPVIPKTKQSKEVGASNFRYKYASLDIIVGTVQSLLYRHGLSYRFDTAFEASPPAQVVTCIVHHRGGHSESSEFRTPLDPRAGSMNEMQR